jgi:hypothetical protein
MKQIILTIGAVLLSATVSVSAVANEKTITVVHSSSPGGLIDGQNQALQRGLEKEGYKVNVVRTKNCRQAQAWIKDNPKASVAMTYHTEEQAYLDNFPKSDDACDLGFDKSKLLAVTTGHYTTVCSMLPADQAAQKFFAGNHKVGVTYYAAVNHLLAEGILDSLKVKAKISRLQGNSKLLQALVSGDVDFTIQGNAASAVKAGATCFLTTAPKSYAQKEGMMSLEEFDAKNPWIGRGHLFAYIGMNLSNVNEVQKIAVNTVNKDEIIQKQLKVNGYKAGVATGESVDQQWTRVNQHIKGYSKK